MTREELFASLAKKKIPPFATSVLGFTLGSLMDHGATADEVKLMCDFLIGQIAKAKENPEIVANVKEFSSLIETSVAR